MHTEDFFNRSGLAALSDLKTEKYRDIFLSLEKQQAEFLRKANKFRSKEYKWPNDPLHCWSRVWEYPYVYYHMNHYVQSLTKDIHPVVADVGSGVTFFPFSLARLGCDVICTDIDPICEADILRAREHVPYSPGNVSFRLINTEKLPFADCECDVLYCISVLEHIPNFENTVTEMVRVLKPGGLCLITCDLGLDPKANTQLNTHGYYRFISAIGDKFSLLYPERTIHPADVLTNRNSPFADKRNINIRVGWQLIKQKIIKPLLGRAPGYMSLIGPPPLAIFGCILKKNEE